MNRPQFQIHRFGDRFKLWSRPSKDRMWVISHLLSDEAELARLIDRRLDLYGCQTLVAAAVYDMEEPS